MPSRPYTPIRLDDMGFAATRSYEGTNPELFPHARGPGRVHKWAGVSPVPGGARLTYFHDNQPRYAWQFTSVEYAVKLLKKWNIYWSSRLPSGSSAGSPSVSMDRLCEKAWRYDREQERFVERSVKASEGGAP